MRKSLTLAGIAVAAALTLGACGGDDDTISAADREKASAAAIDYMGGGAVTDAERGDGDDAYAYAVEVTLPNGTDIDVELDDSFAVTNNPPKASDFTDPSAAPSDDASSAPSSTPGSEDDQALTGDTLKKATDAALQETGGGTVTETSNSDDADHAYEVDVDLDNGEDVTVELDESFAVTKVDR